MPLDESSRRVVRQPPAFLNAVGLATPPHDVQEKFVDYAPRALASASDRRLFERMAQRAQIDRRFSTLAPDPDPDRVDRGGFYRRGRFPGTGDRMRRFEADAPALASAAVEDLAAQAGPDWREGITHLVVTSCTGFYAPGIDRALIEGFDLPRSIERTLIGFMGCNAAFNALKLARHVVRSDPDARVLMLNLELCTLHFQEPADLEQALTFLLFADGCAAALVSAESQGLELERFASTLLPDCPEDIAWRIGDGGFDMRLTGRVPKLIGTGLGAHLGPLLAGAPPEAVPLWAVHPGGRSILDAVEGALALPEAALRSSREVLRDFGNMSSATVMFVLRRLLDGPPSGRRGVALGFGPGVGVESLVFREAA